MINSKDLRNFSCRIARKLSKTHYHVGIKKIELVSSPIFELKNRTKTLQYRFKKLQICCLAEDLI